MKTRTWEKDGVKHYTTEIVLDTFKMLGGKKEAEAGQPAAAASAQDQKYVAPDGQSYDNNGDDLPF